MGPRRILAVLSALALAALVATAGMAVASEGPGVGRGHAAGADQSDHGAHVAHGALVEPGVEDSGESDDVAGATVDVSAAVGSDISGGVTISGSGQGSVVTETGVDAPPAPVKAPAVAASGPAPDAATAAPVIGTVVGALAVSVGTPDAPGGDVPATATASATEPVAPVLTPVSAPASTPAPAASEHEGLPVLGSLGEVADRVTDESSAARTFLSSTPPRSLAVVALLLIAVGLFLSIHRWADRGDHKLAAAPRGPDVARFR